MELSETDKNKLIYAINLQSKDKNEEALKVLEQLIPNNPKNHRVLALYGLYLAKVNNYEKIIRYLENVLKENSKNELLHLALYISFVQVESHDIAFKILFDYLKKNPVGLFKYTLEKLLEDLNLNYNTPYKEQILHYSRQSKIPIPKELL